MIVIAIYFSEEAKMFIKNLVLASSLLLVPVAGANASILYSDDFSSPVVTGPSQAPGVWYNISSLASIPASFSVVGGQLEEVISPSLSLEYQGRSYLMPGGVVEVRTNLFIDPSWATTGREMASLWGITTNSSNNSISLPIMGFTSDGAGPRFQGWNSVSGFWYNLGIPIGFVYGQHEIGFRLTGPNSVEYLLDGIGIGTTPIVTSERLELISLHGLSYPDQPGNYSILWDDVVASDASPDDNGGGGGGGVADVPEPASLTLLGAGIFGLGMMQKRRIRKTARLS